MTWGPFMTFDYQAARLTMVESQVRTSDVTDLHVQDAMRLAARESLVPADKQGLITDLFEKITLYDLKADAATARKRPDGRYDVTLRLTAAKAYADGVGKEMPAPMNETVNIGLFDEKPDEKGFGPRDVITYEKRPLHSGTQSITFVTARAPKFAGVDPYIELIQRNTEANIVAVK